MVDKKKPVSTNLVDKDDEKEDKVEAPSQIDLLRHAERVNQNIAKGGTQEVKPVTPSQPTTPAGGWATPEQK